MVVVSFKSLFSKIIKQENSKETKKKIFIFLGPTRINLCSYVSSFIMENQGHVVFYEKIFKENNLFEDVDIIFFNI